MDSPDELRDVIERAWQSYRILSKGPTQLKSTRDSVLALLGPLQLIHEVVEAETGLSPADRGSVRDTVDDSNSVLSDLEIVFSRFRSGKVNIDRVVRVHSRVQDVASQLETFFGTLRRYELLVEISEKALGLSYSQGKISSVLEQTRATQHTEPQRSMFEKELLKAGLAQDLIDGEYYFIDDWIKRTDGRPNEEGHDPELPGYTPGESRGAVAEEFRLLTQTTMAMSPDGQNGSGATGTKADPPAYTFERGGQGLLDDDFKLFIDNAIDTEASLLFIEREIRPVTAVGWLPKHLQLQYDEIDDIITSMPPDSFSTMAYQTATNVVANIKRL